jgi:archaellum component FlaC
VELFVCQTKSYATMMAMMMPREAWTDERLDDLSTRVDNGFARMDARFDRMEARFDKVDERFERMDQRFDERFERMEDRFAALQRTLMQGGFVIIAALVGLIATQL